MEEADTQGSAKEKPPKVPIQTYRWEDLRRAKLRGGYPWTYLYKEPYDGEPHPEHYTMEEFRRTRSSCTLGKAGTSPDIQELTNGSTSERGSVEPIITEAATPEPPREPRPRDTSIVTLESADSSDNISQYLDKDEKETEATKKDQLSVETKEGPSNGRSERAKSEEPKRKRKHSIESSYSRISLSRLGVMKKLKDAKDKIKVPKLSFRRKRSKQGSQEIKQEKPVEKEKKTKKPSQPEKPVYIHIPLKPPPGETDEFSHLEFEERPQVQPSSSTTIPEEPVSSPDSPPFTSSDIQFIVLTPPSDDEILSDPSIPDTPSESGEKFFDNVKILELKSLAKNAVDEVQKKKLETVEEENGNGKRDSKESEVKKEDNEVSNVEDKKQTDVKEIKEEMVVDVEDGLRVSEATIKKEASTQDEETKEESRPSSSASQVEEKRKSFRKKGKKEDGERIYEDVQAPTNKEAATDLKIEDTINKLQATGTSQSMSVDEEKTYLDEKIIKSTSLEEDYNKWSKINDHEYEPVNPPPDNMSPPPQVHVTDTSDTNIHRPSFESSTTSLERHQLAADGYDAQQLQQKIDERFFAGSPETTDCEINTSQVDSSALEELPLKKDKRKGFQQAFRDQAGRFKTKMQGIKKPNITAPKFKIEKPKINFPKIPDRTVIQFPTFTKKKKKVINERQFSTESNAGDTKRNIFDFRTYPRMFKKKPIKDDLDSASSKDGHEPTPPVEFATVPRTAQKKSRWKAAFSSAKAEQPKRTEGDRFKGKDSIRIPLHSEDSVEEPLEPQARLDEIDANEAFENQGIHDSNEYNPRWDHGTFHPDEFQDYPNQPVTDLDNDLPEAQTPPSDSFEADRSKEIHSSGSSLGPHHRGVLEEINSDEFFLRQKGISQDNIDMGIYLSSEIREAFRSPENVLSQMQDDGYYDTRGSNRSLQERFEKRSPIKKPKRKKTPRASQEQIINQYAEALEHTKPVPPTRPGRRNKKDKKRRLVPYQETIPLDSEENLALQRGREALQKEELKYLDDEDLGSHPQLYQNEQMEGIQQPDIQVTDPYAESIFKFQTYQNTKELHGGSFEKPDVPPRKHRSLKSLNYSEHDSILGDFDAEKIDRDSSIPSVEPPIPPKRHQSRTRSQSRATSQPDDDRTSRGAESLVSEHQIPCVEEPCIQDLRDPMGYAIIDKKQIRDPPLPPPRTPPRRRRSLKGSEEKFSTVPRSNDKPVRPLRNYSTLGPSRPSRSRRVPNNMTDEEKENVDITQYIEIEEEPSSHLQSGDVIQKMRDRPLPPPPRPPRKPRPLHDITNEENVQQGPEEMEKVQTLEESEVSTQTEPLPEGFVCEEASQQSPRVKRHLETPRQYSYEETVTHASILIEPLNGAQIIPESQFSRIDKPKEHIINVSRENVEEQTSEVPEEFKKLANPPQKVQVSELDVDKLTVNELTANRITVSQIDGVTIQVNEITSRSGGLRVNEIELPPRVIQEIVDKIQSSQGPSGEAGQKKTPIESLEETPNPKSEEIPPQFETTQDDNPQDPPQRPPRQGDSCRTEESSVITDSNQNLEEPEVDDEPPPRPPRPLDEYFPSQPPASFYALRAQQFAQDDIPLPPRRRRHQKAAPISSSEDSAPAVTRRRVRSPEPSIPQLTGQLVRACGYAADRSFKRLITHITKNVLNNADGQQDMHVMVLILLVLIAGLILIGWGEGRTVIHHHHWEFFFPPKEL